MGTEEAIDTAAAPDEETDRPSHQARDPRHLVCIAAQLETDATVRRAAVTWDVSSSGALLLTRGPVKVGASVRVVLHMPDGPTSGCILTGKVVRSQMLDRKRIGLWSESFAVRFDQPIDVLRQEIERLSVEQAQTFGVARA